MSTDDELDRIKRLAHEVRRTNGGYVAHRNFHDALRPELLLALVECAQSLKELYQKKVTTLIPEDHDFQRPSVALARLEAECLPLI